MVTFSQIRSAIDTQLSDLSGFKRSKYPANFIQRNPKTRTHLGFAVDIQSTQSIGNRQRRSVAVMLSTIARVVYAYKLRPLSIYPVDYDAALEQEKTVILEVLKSYEAIQAGIEIIYNSSSRNFSESLEYLITDLQFTIIHSIKE
jgi:hypothetical protein